MPFSVLLVKDEKLLGYVDRFGQNSWNRIMKLLPGKSEIKCHMRWMELTNRGKSAGPWTIEEDRALV